MFKSRLLTALFILSLWISTTGFAPLSQGPFAVTRPIPQNQINPFTKYKPANGLGNAPVSLSLTWNASSPAPARYEYCYDTTNDDACSNWTPVSGSTTSAAISGLANNTAYYWQVRAYDANDGTYRYADNSGSGVTPFWSFTTKQSDVNLPGNFGKNSPVNGTAVTTFTADLSWGSSLNAVTYEYCLDTTNDTACDEGAWKSVSVSPVSVSGLIAGQTYYWQVRAHNSYGYTYANGINVWYAFTTPAAPGVFAKNGNAGFTANGAANVSLRPTLGWTAADGAASYQYCINTAPNCTSNGADWVSGVKGTSITPAEDLAPSTVYYWQVSAVNGSAAAFDATGGWWSFTTMALPLQPFDKTDPLDGSSNVSLTPTLSWNASVHGASYLYCLNTAPNCEGSSWQPTSDQSVTLSQPLEYNQTYYWQVRALNPASQETLDANGGWWSFTTVLQPFSKTSPVSGSVAVPVHTVLSWNPSARASYEYCINTQPDCTSGKAAWVSAGPETSVTQDLDDNRTYYWQVQAVNLTTHVRLEASGGWQNFTTRMQPFGKTSPADSAPDVSRTPQLIWEKSARASEYRYCVSTAPVCPEDGWVSVGAGSSAALAEPLAYNQTYYWQVLALDTNGETMLDSLEADGQVWHSFTTLMEPFAKSGPADQAVDISRTPTLSWSASARADGYEYCLSTEDGVCPGDIWTEVGSAPDAAATTSVTLPELDYTQTVYWQVRAFVKSGDQVIRSLTADDGAWHSFTTLMQPFHKLTPADGSPERQPLRPTLTWESSLRATGYVYCLSQEKGVCPGDIWTPVPGTSLTLSDALDWDTPYFWQVRALNGDRQAMDADSPDGWFSFKTMMQPAAAFSKQSPANSLAPRQSPAITLAWEDSARAVKYAYCLSDSPSCPQDGWTETFGTSALVNLENDQTYYWQVVAINGAGQPTEANEGTWWSFHTFLPAPGGFQKQDPANLSGDQPLRPDLRWLASQNAVWYEYCVNTEANCDTHNAAWVKVESALEATLTKDLDWSTTYYWQVRAANGDSEPVQADDGAWYSFTTLDQVLPPAKFNKLTPENGLTPRQPASLTLAWEASDGAVTYRYCVTTADPCSQDGWVETTSTSVLLDLENGKVYHWQVIALNATGQTTAANEDTWWEFSTRLAAPQSFHKLAPKDLEANLTLRPDFTWSASQNAEYYTYCVNTEPTCADNQWVKVDTNDPVTLDRDLVRGETYYWQVQAANADHAPVQADAGSWFSFTIPLEPAGAFAKLGPDDGAQKLDPFPTLRWNPSDKAVRYEYCLSATKNVCPDDRWLDAGTKTSLVVTGLDYATTYYWQVRAVNGTGQVTTADAGTWWSFTTHNRSHWFYLPLIIK